MKFLIACVIFFLSAFVCASDEEIFNISIIQHQFVPSQIIVPAGKRIKLIVKNTDSTVEEFESYDLNREKLVPGKSEIKVLFGPLKPGIYKFFGEFHEATAQGQIVVK
jgi:hypothetical protein